MKAGLVCAAGLTALVATAAVAAEKPKLVVAIAVDQFSADLFSEYRSLFTDGFKRLESGVVFPRGHQSHAATETCPGHSTILTGARPARTGIIANNWEAPSLPRKERGGTPTYSVYCVENPGAAGGDVTNMEVSPQFLRVPTLGDRLKAADARSRVVAVSGKDRAAVMMAGHHADVTLWWTPHGFDTYPSRLASLPAELNIVNSKALNVIGRPPAVRLPEICTAKSFAMPVSGSRPVGTLQPRPPGSEGSWRASPDFDVTILDGALALFANMKLGSGPAVDVLAISFSATDYVGHTYGTEGAEMCAQLIALDHTLGRLFAALDKSGVSYVVVLTADHGGHDLPERNDMRGLPAAERVDPALSAAAVGKKLADRFGMNESALLGRWFFGDMYLSPAVPAAQRAPVLDAAVSFYRGSRQVAAVFTKSELAAAPPPAGPVDEWTLLERAKASFDLERSGDFVVLLKPYVTPIPVGGATHGSPWGYDRRVPILFWWKDVRGFEQPNAIETVDIMPTLASFIDLKVPANEIDGRCLDLMAGPQSNCN